MYIYRWRNSLQECSGKNAWQSVDIHVDDLAFSCRKVCEEMELRWCIKPQDFLEILWIDISLELYCILQIMQATTACHLRLFCTHIWRTVHRNVRSLVHISTSVCRRKGKNNHKQYHCLMQSSCALSYFMWLHILVYVKACELMYISISWHWWVLLS